MQLTLNRKGLEDLYLMVPAYFDECKNAWCATLVIPKAKKALFAEGHEIGDLMKSIDHELTAAIDDYPQIEKMFKPYSHWKGRI